MKKLLHLYNYGHNPFPKLGRGGLGYHLPQYKLRGDGLHFITNPDGKIVPIDDLDYSDKHFYYDTNARSILNPTDDDENTDEELDYEGVINLKEMNENKKKEKYEQYEQTDKKIQEIFDKYDKYKLEKEQPDEDDEKPNVKVGEDINSIPNVIYKNFTREELIKWLDDYGYDVDNIPKSWTKRQIINEILTNEELTNVLYDEGLKKASQEEEKLPKFDIPDIIISKLSEKEIKPIVDIELVSPDESYSDVVNNINTYSKKEDVYNSLFPTFKLKKESIDYKQTFALKNSVKDLTIEIDGEEYKPTGGIDFELKVKDNMPFFKAIVDQYLGVDATIISVKPDSSGYDKADYIIEIKMKGEDKSIFIDLELKKYMTEQGVKGQDLAAYKNKTAFDSIDKINEGTTTLFNNWFYTFKKELHVLYRRCQDKNNFTEYNTLLNSVSTNNKFDSQKLLMQHVISGKYFPLPLTITKFKTPSREIIDTTMKKRYPEKTQLHSAVSNYMYGHWKRLNKSENILIPVLLINDGMLSMNVKQKFGNLIPFEVLQIVNNIYSHAEKDALGLPACFLSNINLPPEALSISSKRSVEELREEYKKEILEKKEKQQANKNKQPKTKSKKTKNIIL
jgi:hypothetical protein